MLLPFVMYTDNDNNHSAAVCVKMRDVSPPLFLSRGLAVHNSKKTIISYPPCGDN